jgi:hypothetical protein
MHPTQSLNSRAPTKTPLWSFLELLLDTGAAFEVSGTLSNLISKFLLLQKIDIC